MGREWGRRFQFRWSGAGEAGGSGPGLGLKNLRECLDIAFAGRVKLSLRQENRMGVVRVRVPRTVDAPGSTPRGPMLS